MIDGLELFDREELDKLKGDIFSEVVGLDMFKKYLKTMISLRDYNGVDYGEISPSKGILLYGPPGCGKTRVVRYAAKYLGLPVLYISGASLLSPLSGVGRSKVRDLFAYARECTPCLLFIDEIDAVIKNRMTGGSDSGGALQQLLVELDGYTSNEGLFFMAATNTVWSLDPAVIRPGRLNRKIKIGRPTTKQRLEFFNIKLNNMQMKGDIDLKSLCEITENSSYAELNAIWEEGVKDAFVEGRSLTTIDLILAVQSVMKGDVGTSDADSRVEKTILVKHLAGHTLAYIIDPELFVYGSCRMGAGLCCKPITKEKEVSDIRDLLIHIVSYGLARQADIRHTGGGSSLYEKDKIELDALINKLFVLLGMEDYGLKDVEGLKRKIIRELAIISKKLFDLYTDVYDDLVKEYESNEIISRESLKNILRSKRLTATGIRKNYIVLRNKLLIAGNLKLVADQLNKIDSEQEEQQSKKSPSGIKMNAVKKNSKSKSNDNE